MACPRVSGSGRDSDCSVSQRKWIIAGMTGPFKNVLKQMSVKRAKVRFIECLFRTKTAAKLDDVSSQHRSFKPLQFLMTVRSKFVFESRCRKGIRHAYFTSYRALMRGISSCTSISPAMKHRKSAMRRHRRECPRWRCCAVRCERSCGGAPFPGGKWRARSLGQQQQP